MTQKSTDNLYFTSFTNDLIDELVKNNQEKSGRYLLYYLLFQDYFMRQTNLVSIDKVVSNNTFLYDPAEFKKYYSIIKDQYKMVSEIKELWENFSNLQVKRGDWTVTPVIYGKFNQHFYKFMEPIKLLWEIKKIMGSYIYISRKDVVNMLSSNIKDHIIIRYILLISRINFYVTQKKSNVIPYSILNKNVNLNIVDLSNTLKNIIKNYNLVQPFAKVSMKKVGSESYFSFLK